MPSKGQVTWKVCINAWTKIRIPIVNLLCNSEQGTTLKTVFVNLKIQMTVSDSQLGHI